jgi:hypothetical protein
MFLATILVCRFLADGRWQTLYLGKKNEEKAAQKL